VGGHDGYDVGDVADAQEWAAELLADERDTAAERRTRRLHDQRIAEHPRGRKALLDRVDR
jgi:hypothetical protein